MPGSWGKAHMDLWQRAHAPGQEIHDLGDDAGEACVAHRLLPLNA